MSTHQREWDLVVPVTMHTKARDPRPAPRRTRSPCPSPAAPCPAALYPSYPSAPLLFLHALPSTEGDLVKPLKDAVDRLPVHRKRRSHDEAADAPGSLLSPQPAGKQGNGRRARRAICCRVCCLDGPCEQGFAAHLYTNIYPPPFCNSHALVQATVGVGTAIIWDLILIQYQM